MKQIKGYAWSSTGLHYNATAEQAHEAFESIRQRDGKLTPAAVVVKDARPEESVLHEDFEWRDDVAAERYREGQARKMIGSVRILRVDSRPPVRAYVNVRVIEQKPLKFEDVVRQPEPEADETPEQENNRCYMPMQEVLQKPALYDQMMADARRDAQTYRQKYSTLKELAPIMDAIQTTFETEV